MEKYADVTTRKDLPWKNAMHNDARQTKPGEPYMGVAQDANLNPVDTFSLPDGRTIRVKDWRADATLHEAVFIHVTGVLCAPPEAK